MSRLKRTCSGSGRSGSAAVTPARPKADDCERIRPIPRMPGETVRNVLDMAGARSGRGSAPIASGRQAIEPSRIRMGTSCLAKCERRREPTIRHYPNRRRSDTEVVSEVEAVRLRFDPHPAHDGSASGQIRGIDGCHNNKIRAFLQKGAFLVLTREKRSFEKGSFSFIDDQTVFLRWILDFLGIRNNTSQQSDREHNSLKTESSRFLGCRNNDDPIKSRIPRYSPHPLIFKPISRHKSKSGFRP